MTEHRILSKPPKRLAVVDQSGCSGCAGSPACQSYCETVTAKKLVVDAIRTVKSPESPFELAIVEPDRCIGCGLCATACPWEAISMHSYEDAVKVAPGVTLVGYDGPPGNPAATVEAAVSEGARDR
jgi:Fe-S-cluster-containing dehydrogenase component